MNMYHQKRHECQDVSLFLPSRPGAANNKRIDFEKQVAYPGPHGDVYLPYVMIFD